MSQCVAHPKQPAIATCAGCHHALCQWCVAEEREGRTFCRPCLLGAIATDMRAEAVADREARDRAEALRKRLRQVGLALGGAVVAAELVAVFLNPPKLQEPVHAWTADAPAPSAGKGEECAVRLLAARIALDRSMYGTGTIPPSLEALGAGEGGRPLQCPGSGRPFDYRPSQPWGSIACPNPQVHGVADMYSEEPATPPNVTPFQVAKAGEGPR